MGDKFSETIEYVLSRVRANPRPLDALQLSQAAASLANAKATLGLTESPGVTSAPEKRVGSLPTAKA